MVGRTVEAPLRGDAFAAWQVHAAAGALHHVLPAGRGLPRFAALDAAAVSDIDDLQRLLGEPVIGRELRLTLLRLTDRCELTVVPAES